MRTVMKNKAIVNERRKLSPAAQAAYDRHVAELGVLTPDEQNEVGRLVAVAAEAASSHPGGSAHWERMRALYASTEAEQRAIDEATAQWQVAVDVMEAARAAAMEAEREVLRLLRDDGDAVQLARAQQRRSAAEVTLDAAVKHEQLLQGPIGAARGAAIAGGKRRIAALVG